MKIKYELLDKDIYPYPHKILIFNEPKEYLDDVHNTFKSWCELSFKDRWFIDYQDFGLYQRSSSNFVIFVKDDNDMMLFKLRWL